MMKVFRFVTIAVLLGGLASRWMSLERREVERRRARELEKVGPVHALIDRAKTVPGRLHERMHDHMHA